MIVGVLGGVASRVEMGVKGKFEQSKKKGEG